jgi:hypothetical protein
MTVGLRWPSDRLTTRPADHPTACPLAQVHVLRLLVTSIPSTKFASGAPRMGELPLVLREGLADCYTVERELGRGAFAKLVEAGA